MPREITIRTETVTLRGTLNDTPTAQAVAAALPIHAQAQTWGEEVYFPIPVEMPLEADAKTVVAVGDIGYWPRGAALCLFFGPTPLSRGGEIVPASAVNLIGRIEGDATLLKSVKDGDEITVA